MDRNVSLWLPFHLALMIGYFLLLTVVLPSTFAYAPNWIKVGSFAEYSVDDKGGGDTPIVNGTYAWNVAFIETKDGRTLVTINETFKGATRWDHVAEWDETKQAYNNIIPPSGKITRISMDGVTDDGLILWLGRYHNQILLDRTFFLGIPGHVWLGIGEGEMPFQGQTRQILHVEASEEWQWSRTADYDKATGILMSYRWTWPRLGTVWVSLKSTNAFASTISGPKIFLDLLSTAPLFILPLIGTIIGLSSIRKRGVGFRTRFWLGFILLNGALIAILSNSPINKTPIVLMDFIESGMLTIGLVTLGFFLINVAFWTGILGAAILTINRFVYPVIAKN